MDISTLMTWFADPNRIGSLSYIQKMQGTAFTVFLGIGVTFIVLVVLMFAIELMSAVLAEKTPPVAASSVKNLEEEIAAAALVASIVANVPVDRVVVKPTQK